MERLKAAGRAFVGKIPPHAWLETYWLWSIFVKYRKHAARKYQHFVEGVTWDSPENPGKNLIGGKLPGSTELVDRAKSTFLYKTGAMEKHHSLQALPEVSIGLVIKGSQ